MNKLSQPVGPMIGNDLPFDTRDFSNGVIMEKLLTEISRTRIYPEAWEALLSGRMTAFSEGEFVGFNAGSSKRRSASERIDTLLRREEKLRSKVDQAHAEFESAKEAHEEAMAARHIPRAKYAVRNWRAYNEALRWPWQPDDLDISRGSGSVARAETDDAGEIVCFDLTARCVKPLPRS